MKLDVMLGSELADIEDSAARAERLGCGGVWAAESAHDPFVPLVLAARATSSVDIGTGIAVAFARNPMTVATTANDIHAWSGRLVLGLGSQVKAHITRRYGMEWSRPAARMREFIAALHSIWSCWNDGTPLDFRGDFYSHTLMPAHFSPPPNRHGRPAVHLAGVGTLMTEVAGEVADGFLTHPFSTEVYLRTVTLPALERGAARAGRAIDAIALSAPGFVVTGSDEVEMARAERAVRRQIALYGSTPGYADVLGAHGWIELQEEASRLLQEGRAGELPQLVDDEMLRTFAVVGEPATIAPELERRYGDIATRVVLDMPYGVGPEVLAELVDAAA